MRNTAMTVLCLLMAPLALSACGGSDNGSGAAVATNGTTGEPRASFEVATETSEDVAGRTIVLRGTIDPPDGTIHSPFNRAVGRDGRWSLRVPLKRIGENRIAIYSSGE